MVWLLCPNIICQSRHRNAGCPRSMGPCERGSQMGLVALNFRAVGYPEVIAAGGQGKSQKSRQWKPDYSDPGRRISLPILGKSLWTRFSAVRFRRRSANSGSFFGEFCPNETEN